jgi:glycosyltransferase involved in cell wall biosynthesis
MITVCMSYYNRKPLLLNTLASIMNSQYKDEVFMVIVDDASDEEHRLIDSDIVFPHTLISIKKKDKWWKNAAYPNNIALQAIPKETNVVLLQNPENYHVGDVLKKVILTKDNEYVAFACYYMLSHSKLISPLSSTVPAEFDKEGWVCHSKYKPNFLNYACAFTPSTLYRIGLFDSRFYNGVCFDDNEWVERIKHIGIDMSICDDPYVKHQFHDRVHADQYLRLEDINRKVLHEIRTSNNYNWHSTGLH